MNWMKRKGIEDRLWFALQTSICSNPFSDLYRLCLQKSHNLDPFYLRKCHIAINSILGNKRYLVKEGMSLFISMCTPFFFWPTISLNSGWGLPQVRRECSSTPFLGLGYSDDLSPSLAWPLQKHLILFKNLKRKLRWNLFLHYEDLSLVFEVDGSSKIFDNLPRPLSDFPIQRSYFTRNRTSLVIARTWSRTPLQFRT